MNYTPNSIYTYIRNAVKASFPSAYTSSKYEPVPRSFPCVMIRVINSQRILRATTLTFSDKQSRMTVEVQVFSNKKNTSQTEANNIMDCVCNAMNGLFFIQDMREPIDNADATVSRVVSRFHRTVGGGDVIPERS